MPLTKKRNPLPPGAKGYANHKGKEYTLVVVRSDEGVAYKVGGKIYPSPSSAAGAITGWATNGWRFWHLDRKTD